MRWSKAAAGLLTIVLLVTGCLKVDGNIKIEEDGSGRVDFLTAIDPDAIASAVGQLGGDSDTLCAQFNSNTDAGDLPHGASYTPYDEGGFCGGRLEYQLEASNDHSDNIADLFSDDTLLYKEGDNWIFSTGVDTSEVTELSQGLDLGLVEGLWNEASVRFTVDLPGRAVDGEHNATEVSNDGTFIWDVDLNNPPGRLFAQTEPGGGGGGFGAILIAAILALGLAGLAFFLFSKRKSAGDASAIDAPSPQAYSPQTAGSPPVRETVAIDPTAPIMTPGGSRETIMIDPAEAQRIAVAQTPLDASIDTPLETDPATQPQAAAATTSDPIETTTSDGVEATTTNQPVYDEALGAWVIDDPTRGRMRHDPATDTWTPL